MKQYHLGQCLLDMREGRALVRTPIFSRYQVVTIAAPIMSIRMKGRALRQTLLFLDENGLGGKVRSALLLNPFQEG
ncbi:hypothetical protein J2S74_002691 [Evansella vedderi]|uniref:Uncharacterized protein n=1 Tax=Evansella vedderi TaxID=38282 RepID=A0ABT9ZWR4_9BACI|nr:hypothetical protein [Evansella vedderi]